MLRIAFQKGFGLIEIMVGLLIGLISTIIMFQAFSVSESQKRTTTGAADAQSNGAISLFSIERDVKMAGWGLQGSVFANCETFYTYDTTTGGAIDANPTPGSSLISVLNIIDGGNMPDTITVRHYDDPSSQDFRFAIASLTTAQATAGDRFSLTSVRGCNVNDLIVVSDGLNCTLAQVSTIDLASRSAEHAVGPRFNAPALEMAAWPAHGASSRAQCFPRFFTRAYSIETATFQLQVTQETGVSAVSPQIMDLQAEYGIDRDDGLPGTQWVPATGDWANPSLANIRRIKAARVAILSRSSTFEKPEDGSACATTTDAMLADMSTWATFTGAGFPDDWHCYRYKAYEINVPLRNVIWSRT